MFIKNKLKVNVLLPILILLSIVDIWGIDKRYVNDADFVAKNKVKNQFTQTNADKLILKDTDPYFRVVNNTVNTFNDNTTSYWHHSVGGYSAAKLRRYQDVIERHLSQNNMNVYNMLNTKYFIVKGADGSPTARLNNQAYGNAWFVDQVKYVNSSNEEIDALNDTELNTVAVVHNEFKSQISNVQPAQGGTINLESYKPNHLVYNSNNSTESLAVFSEIWYGPEKGWKALVDGKEAEIIRTNYLLRGLKIPAGKHKIEMVFDPASFRLGNIISMLSSLLLILLGGWVVTKKVINK